jgi:uncharacterized RDD family membrane protein YckC
MMAGAVRGSSLAALMRIDRLARRPVEAAVRSSRTALVGEVERMVEVLVSGPFPELVARAIVEERLVERVATETLAATGNGRDETLEEAVERLVAGVVESPAFERALVRVLASPAVRQAATHEALSLGDEVADGVRALGERCDEAVDSRLRRWTRRAPAAPRLRRYAGFCSRFGALAVDTLIVDIAFLIGVGTFALVAGLVHRLPGAGVAAAVVGVAWTLMTVAYFAGFWTVTGRTPGMRLLGMRVLGPHARPPSALRSLARVVLAVVPLTLVVVLFDRRRRALHDLVTGTVVVRVDQRAGAGA